MKTTGIILAVMAGLIFLGAVGFGLKILFFPVHTAGLELQTAYDAASQTLNADNAIYNYEWFKRQKESIEAIKQKLVISQDAVLSFEQSAGERKDWTFEDKGEDARLRAVSQGIESQLKDVIAEYNARTKMANRAIFQDGILPNYIDATTFILK